ncbi:MAG: PepSY domain-containing protein [Gammaproteobacteria bacterium]|nr:PepSY domain-containing protein [Gammaproteobacteria bacterium]
MRYLPIFFSAVLVSTAALASDDSYRCSGIHSDQAKTKEQIAAHFEAQGWEIRRIKADDGCFEIYGIDRDGKRREAYIDPNSLEIIRDDKDNS